MVARFFSQQPQQLPPGPATAATTCGSATPPAADEAEAVEQLQREVVRLQEERARVARLRLEMEEAAGRLRQEQVAFEKHKVRGRAAGSRAA